MNKYIENQVDDEIKPLEDFVNTYSYTENEKQIIIEFIGIHQLIYDDKVKKHLITETCKKCDVLFISKLNQIKNEYQQYIRNKTTSLLKQSSFGNTFLTCLLYIIIINAFFHYFKKAFSCLFCQ